MKNFLFSLLCLCSANSLFADNFRYLTIGTGSVTGIYYPAGGIIAKVMNEKQKEYQLRISTQPSAGTIENLKNLKKQQVQFALAQSGLTFRTQLKSQPNLRGIFALHSEAVTLLVSEPSGIKSCADLKDKKIAVGTKGTGTQQGAKAALSTCGLTFDDLASAKKISNTDAITLMHKKKLDGYFFTVGHPNGSTQESVANHSLRLVPFHPNDEFFQLHPFARKANIPVKLYEGILNTEDVSSLGITALFITTAEMDEEIVYSITREIFENFDRFIKFHPAYNEMNPDNMVKNINIPLHKGAIKYYKEMGLM
jgi:uncharacterized protein